MSADVDQGLGKRFAYRLQKVGRWVRDTLRFGSLLSCLEPTQVVLLQVFTYLQIRSAFVYIR